MLHVNQASRFRLGALHVTPTVEEQILPDDFFPALARHARGDWGDCSPNEAAENDVALKDAERLFSKYHDRNGKEFWIITERDRTETTILLPEDF